MGSEYFVGTEFSFGAGYENILELDSGDGYTPL